MIDLSVRTDRDRNDVVNCHMRYDSYEEMVQVIGMVMRQFAEEESADIAHVVIDVLRDLKEPQSLVLDRSSKSPSPMRDSQTN